MTGFDYKAELDAARARIVADTNRRYTAAWDRIHAETPGERAEREPVTRPRTWGVLWRDVIGRLARLNDVFSGRARE